MGGRLRDILFHYIYSHTTTNPCYPIAGLVQPPIVQQLKRRKKEGRMTWMGGEGEGGEDCDLNRPDGDDVRQEGRLGLLVFSGYLNVISGQFRLTS